MFQHALDLRIIYIKIYKAEWKRQTIYYMVPVRCPCVSRIRWKLNTSRVTVAISCGRWMADFDVDFRTFLHFPKSLQGTCITFTLLKNTRKTSASQLMVSCGWKIGDYLNFCQQEAPLLVICFHPHSYSAFTKEAAPSQCWCPLGSARARAPRCGPPSRRALPLAWSLAFSRTTDRRSCQKKQGWGVGTRGE